MTRHICLECCASVFDPKITDGVPVCRFCGVRIYPVGALRDLAEGHVWGAPTFAAEGVPRGLIPLAELLEALADGQTPAVIAYAHEVSQEKIENTLRGLAQAARGRR